MFLKLNIHGCCEATCAINRKEIELLRFKIPRILAIHFLWQPNTHKKSQMTKSFQEKSSSFLSLLLPHASLSPRFEILLKVLEPGGVCSQCPPLACFACLFLLVGLNAHECGILAQLPHGTPSFFAHHPLELPSLCPIPAHTVMLASLPSIHILPLLKSRRDSNLL